MLPNLRVCGKSREVWRKEEPINAKLPPKFSEDDWLFNNKMQFRKTCEQECLAERIVGESKRVVEETTDVTKDWQREVEHHIQERTKEIRFLCDELNKQKKTAMVEEEALNTFRDRVLNAIEFLKEKSLEVCQRCCVLREGRIGVELCDDEVDRQLRREMKVIKGCQGLMDKTLRETTEQLRVLREAMYLLDKDLEQKDKSLLIDEKNLVLRESNVPDVVGDDATQHFCRFTLSEWEHVTYRNIETNAKALTAASQLRAYIDLILQQVCEDMKNQTERTNEAFERRIAEVTHVKRKLEEKHSDTMIHVNDVQKNIQLLEKEFNDKKRALALCQARLNNRARRPGLELTCDIVQDTLYSEENALKNSLCKLKQKWEENKATLRYLLHIQVMQAEEINMKTNTIKIDEVDCMTIRQVLKYQSF